MHNAKNIYNKQYIVKKNRYLKKIQCKQNIVKICEKRYTWWKTIDIELKGIRLKNIQRQSKKYRQWKKQIAKKNRVEKKIEIVRRNGDSGINIKRY